MTTTCKPLILKALVLEYKSSKWEATAILAIIGITMLVTILDVRAIGLVVIIVKSTNMTRKEEVTHVGVGTLPPKAWRATKALLTGTTL